MRGHVASLAGTFAVLSICMEGRAMLLLSGAGAYAPGWRRGEKNAASYRWAAKKEHK